MRIIKPTTERNGRMDDRRSVRLEFHRDGVVDVPMATAIPIRTPLLVRQRSTPKLKKRVLSDTSNGNNEKIRTCLPHRL